MSFRNFATALLCALSLSACASVNEYPSIAKANNVAVADVINQIKCEINAFYETETFSGVDRDLRLPNTKKADVDLKLQIDTSEAAKGSVKLTPLAFAFGPNFTPSLGVTATNTIVSDFKFSMRQTVTGLGRLNENVCPKDANVLGLKEALLNFYANEPRIYNGAPYVGLQSITYSTAFGLAYTGGATAAGAAILTFIPLGPALEASTSQTGVHTLQVTFKGRAAAPPKQG
jgi:hypothetical protein